MRYFTTSHALLQSLLYIHQTPQKFSFKFNNINSSLSFVKMIIRFLLGLILLREMVAGGFRFGVDALSMNYYIMTCPMIEGIVRNAVSSALQDDPTLAGPLLRMHFHDCWIQVNFCILINTLYSLILCCILVRK